MTAEPGGGVVFFREFVEGRRGEILDAALAVFDLRGYDAGTMREIAERVGVSEPALYRHFSGKEALFAEVATLATERFVEQAGALVSGLDPHDLRGSLTAILEDRRRALTRYMPLARVLIAVAVHRDEVRELIVTHLAQPMRGNLMRVVPAVDADLGLSFGPEETAARVRALMALFVGHNVLAIMLGGDEPGPLVDAVLRVMRWE